MKDESEEVELSKYISELKKVVIPFRDIESRQVPAYKDESTRKEQEKRNPIKLFPMVDEDTD